MPQKQPPASTAVSSPSGAGASTAGRSILTALSARAPTGASAAIVAARIMSVRMRHLGLRSAYVRNARSLHYTSLHIDVKRLRGRLQFAHHLAGRDLRPQPLREIKACHAPAVLAPLR